MPLAFVKYLTEENFNMTEIKQNKTPQPDSRYNAGKKIIKKDKRYIINEVNFWLEIDVLSDKVLLSINKNGYIIKIKTIFVKEVESIDVIKKK